MGTRLEMFGTDEYYERNKGMKRGVCTVEEFKSCFSSEFGRAMSEFQIPD
jgi:hypothetical protein